MDASKSLGIVRAGFCSLGIALLSGCVTTPPAIVSKTETELAIEAIKAEWLYACEGVSAGESTNTVGSLLQDYVDAVAALAICMRRHNDFVDYIAPVVAKQKQK